MFSLATLDNLFIKKIGLHYFRCTRDPLVSERCAYVTWNISHLQISDLRVLDVGCGSGALLLWLNEFCRGKIEEYIGIDLNASRLKSRYDSINIKHCFHDINIDDGWELGNFDVIVCMEVMEHVIRDHELFSRMCSSLKEGGMLYVTTPSEAFVRNVAVQMPGFDRVSDVQDGGHVRVGYDPDDFRELATQNGVELVSLNWVSYFSTPLSVKVYYRRIGNIYYNLFHAQHVTDRQFIIGGPEELANSFHSIAPVFRKVRSH